MAVITDVGDEKDIHPRKKGPVGHRLAVAALALTYQKPVEYSGAVDEAMKKDGDKIGMSFEHTAGGVLHSPAPAHRPDCRNLASGLAARLSGARPSPRSGGVSFAPSHRRLCRRSASPIASTA